MDKIKQPQKHLSILSLEDSSIDFEIISENLLQSGFNFDIVRVDNEHDFVTNLQTNTYDLILADFNLPGYGGFEALKSYAKYCPETPFICVSGSIGETTAIELLKQGAVDYVLKDKIERLPFAVKRALDEAAERKERREAVQKLAKSEEKFRNLFENDSAPKVIIDPETLQLIEVNDATANFFGWSVDEMKQMRITDINLNEENEILKKIDLVRHKKKLSFEFHLKIKDGTVKDAEVFASMIRIGEKEFMHSILHDITDKKKAEEQLRLLSLSIDQSPVGISIIEKNHKIQYINPAFTKITGFSPEDAIGKKHEILNSEIQNKDEFSDLFETISKGKIWSGEFTGVRKNGETYWQKLSISPLFDEQQQITHYVCIKEDITDKRKMLEDLIEAKEKAEISDQLKSSFINNISHEIRTPLNGILGFGQILASDEISPDEKSDYLEYLNNSCNRLVNMVTDIMDVSLLNSGNQKILKKEFSISKLVEDILHKFDEPICSRNLILNYLPPANKDFPVFTDRELLGKSIEHILDNAVKFTYQGSITVHYELNDDGLFFTIKDTGIGIAKENQDKIFGYFIQENNTNTRGYEGSGIGLSIAKGFIELLGGKIWLESEKEAGTTFYFTIPCAARQPESKPEQKRQKDEILPPKNTILVAEDDFTNFLYVEALLRKSPIKIIRAENGEEAIHLFKNNPKISLILMDLKMPVMDGFDATKQIKALNSDIPVLALTAYAGNEEKQKAIQSGCDELLLKPLKKEFLLNKLETYGFKVTSNDT